MSLPCAALPLRFIIDACQSMKTLVKSSDSDRTSKNASKKKSFESDQTIRFHLRKPDLLVHRPK